MRCGSGRAVPAGAARLRLRTTTYSSLYATDQFADADVVTLVWLGRRQILGIEPGRQLTARGRIAMRDDRKVMYNPFYELEAPR